MDNYQDKIEQYLPEVAQFLTSLIMEDTAITVVSYQEVEGENILGGLQPKDIILKVFDENLGLDIVAVLDEEWFGILSSVMLGVEEKGFNEVTMDLLRKFSREMMASMENKIDEAENYDFGEVEVMQFANLQDALKCSEYAFAELEVDGLADDSIRAALLVGNPESIKKVQEPEPEEPEEEISAEADEPAGEQAESVTQEAPSANGIKQEIISGKYIEFEDFSETTPPLESEDGQNMDLLKDVEMDVSVELGRIELPLGKVLQLSKGSVIELEKLAGEPVDILVNGQKIAHGEVVVIDEHFGVRISNLLTTKQRLASLS